jgi:hypothetical protein
MSRIPLSDFKVPGGKLAITVALHGMNHPISLVFDPAVIDKLLASVEKIFKLTASDRSNPQAQARLRELTQKALEMLTGENGAPAEGDRPLEGSTGPLLWLALNHYERADTIRGSVASALRRTGKACITIQSDERRTWGFAVADQFVDMAGAMALMPEGEEHRSIAIAKDEPDDGEPYKISITRA